MSLTPSVMEAAIVAELEAQHPTIFPEVSSSPDQATNVTRMCQWIAKMATPIILHFQSYAVVSTTVTGTCNGVTGTGPMGGPLPIASQPTSGSGTGVIS